MLDIGGWELLVIAAVALIVVGPKELPGLVRNVGRWVAKARNMAREFQAGMEAAAKEAELDEIRQVGSLKKEVERKAREIGRLAEDDLNDAVGAQEPAIQPVKASAPKPRPAARTEGERVEPGFDEERMEERWRGPREERYARRD